MPRYTAENGFEIVWYDQRIEDHYIVHLSQMIRDRFGQKRFETIEETNEILFYILNGLMQQMRAFMQDERSLAVYQYVQILHEQSNQIRINNKLNILFPAFNKVEFAIYRRALRLILEQACHVELIFLEPLDIAKNRALQFIEELIYIAVELFDISNLIASQQFLKDSVEIYFNADNLYVIQRKYYYDTLIGKITDDLQSHLDEAIVDQDAIEDFGRAMKVCLGASFGQVIAIVQHMHNSFIEDNSEPFPCAAGVDVPSLIKGLTQISNISYEQAEAIISGLILSEETKCSLEEAIYKPQSIKRHLYRPILKWKVRGRKVDDYIVIVGMEGLRLSFHQLATNAIGWNKYPEEWNNKCFDAYVLDKQNRNDKVLEDHLEDIMKEAKVKYSRNITSLEKKNNQNLNIDSADCGEIDFLILLNGRIYLTDSKYLLARYDFNNWRNDYSAFEGNKKNYNDTIARKHAFLKDKLDLIAEHFEVKYPGEKFELSDWDIECIFLINTPTFYMYNSQYKIFTVRDFKRLLNGEFVYPTFYIMEETPQGPRQSIVNHPYFNKPNYQIFEED